MVTAYIGIGSNVGNRMANIDLARQRLARIDRTTLTDFSAVYETEPVGPVDQRRFLNAAAAVETSLEPRELLNALLAIERDAGRPARDQRQKWGPRALDMDILLYGDRIVDENELAIPHPLMHQRWFVLKPLSDLAPLAVHPVLSATVWQLFHRLDAVADKAAS
jgi:2-amino-4-hydroxy-6-hydroxymethyldihydropteridine diphosphokinase